MNSSAGEAGKDFLVIVGLVIVLGFVWLATGGPSKSPGAEGGPWMKAPPPIGTGSTFGAESAYIVPPRDDDFDGGWSGDGKRVEPDSPYAKSVSLLLVTAARQYRANQEYVVLKLSRNAPAPLNLTGWYVTGERYRSVARVGEGTFLFGSPGSASIFLPIILEPGGQAIITSGAPPRVSPRPPGNFLENACTGYIEEDEENRNKPEFVPSLYQDCPDPDEEPGIRDLDDRCYSAVRSWPRCETTVIEYEEGVRYINGWPSNLNQQCRNYLEEHFGYEQCLRWHQNDAEFFSKTWRIFLNHGEEMFAKNRETVRIFDAQGRLVIEESYD